MQQISGDVAEVVLHIRIDRGRPSLVVIGKMAGPARKRVGETPQKAFFRKHSQNALNTRGADAAAQRMSHHVVAAANNAGVVEAMLLENLTPGRPREPGKPL